MSIGDLFNIIDTDKQGDIDIGELTDMFNKMDLNYLTRP
jgi:Ca2+-binding EF-hand superfamily protein